MPSLPALPQMTIEMWIAIVVIAAGLVLCFFGYIAMRWIFALVGLAAGWQLGTWASTFIDLDKDFNLALQWGTMVLAAILMASLAYAFFVTGVLIAVGYIGYRLGTALAPQVGLVDWQVIAVGVFVALVLVVLALVTKLPKLLIVLLTAVGGAAAMIAGALGVMQYINLRSLSWADVPVLMSQGIAWNLLFLVLAGVGVAVQLRSGTARDLRAAYS